MVNVASCERVGGSAADRLQQGRLAAQSCLEGISMRHLIGFVAAFSYLLDAAFLGVEAAFSYLGAATVVAEINVFVAKKCRIGRREP